MIRLNGGADHMNIIDIIVYISIMAGALLMITNIWRFNRFIKNSVDVLSAGDNKDIVWEYIALALLVFFLIGYVLVAVLRPCLRHILWP